MGKNVFDKKPFMKFDYASVDGSSLRNEYEIKEKIISELQKLKSDKPWNTNSINIDGAIQIVKES